jgi:hypothetical protein
MVSKRLDYVFKLNKLLHSISSGHIGSDLSIQFRNQPTQVYVLLITDLN